MRASAMEFRLRALILFAIYAIGFAPWGATERQRVWLAVPVWLAQRHWATLDGASGWMSAAATAMAVLAALLRTWGTAYLGSDVVRSGALHTERVVADGPFRYVRNPLYLGTIFFSLALCVLMPVWHAVFVIVAVTIFALRLIGAEEARLSVAGGASYAAYRARVPRLVMSVAPRVAGSGAAKPRWGQALLGEILMWGTVVSFAVFAWRYDAIGIERGVLISYGVSLMLRGLTMRPAEA